MNKSFSKEFKDLSDEQFVHRINQAFVSVQFVSFIIVYIKIEISVISGRFNQQINESANKNAIDFKNMIEDGVDFVADKSKLSVFVFV